MQMAQGTKEDRKRRAGEKICMKLVHCRKAAHFLLQKLSQMEAKPTKNQALDKKEWQELCAYEPN